MRTLVVGFLLLSALSAQNFQEASPTPPPFQDFVFPNVPANTPIPYKQDMNSAIQTQFNEKGEIRISIGNLPQTPSNDNQNLNVSPDQYLPNNNPYINQFPADIPEGVINSIIIIYLVFALAALAVPCTLLYFCYQKRQKRQSVKERMRQMQVQFAQAQNINYLELQNIPNFPRTIHI